MTSAALRAGRGTAFRCGLVRVLRTSQVQGFVRRQAVFRAMPLFERGCDDRGGRKRGTARHTSSKHFVGYTSSLHFVAGAIDQCGECVSAHGAERKRYRDPRIARLLSPNFAATSRTAQPLCARAEGNHVKK